MCVVCAVADLFSQLAKKWHPDTSKEKDAAEKFQEIQAAYDVGSSL
jgi:DnaJ-class molecular chaperone